MMPIWDFYINPDKKPAIYSRIRRLHQKNIRKIHGRSCLYRLSGQHTIRIYQNCLFYESRNNTQSYKSIILFLSQDDIPIIYLSWICFMRDGGKKMGLMNGVNWQEINQISPMGKQREHVRHERCRPICTSMIGGA